MSSEHNNPSNPIRIGSRGSNSPLASQPHPLRPSRRRLSRRARNHPHHRRPHAAAGLHPAAKPRRQRHLHQGNRRSLEEGRIDLAVHSLKDLPTKLAPQFTLAPSPNAPTPATSGSANSTGLSTPSHRSRIGTTSPRRRARSSLSVPTSPSSKVRGNIDTRSAN